MRSILLFLLLASCTKPAEEAPKVNKIEIFPAPYMKCEKIHTTQWYAEASNCEVYRNGTPPVPVNKLLCAAGLCWEGKRHASPTL